MAIAQDLSAGLLPPALSCSPCACCCSRCARRSAQQASPLGDNLLPQGCFEQWEADGTPTGWTVGKDKGALAADEAIRLEGQKCLRLDTPAAPARAFVESTPVPCQGGQQYHGRVAYRTQGFSKTNEYAGVAGVAMLVWADGDGKQVGAVLLVDEYYNREWRYRDKLITAPATAVTCRISLQLNAWEKVTWPSTLWFDDVALRPYYPPSAPTGFERQWSVTAGQNVLKVPEATAWFYPNRDFDPKAAAPRVSDSEASLGEALHVLPTSAADYVFHSPYTTEQPPGLYRVFFRLRAPGDPPQDRAANMLTIDVDSSVLSQRGVRRLGYNDFQTPGRYEDLSFDFIKPSGGWLSYRVMTAGKGSEFWIDHVRVVLIHPLHDPDLLSWYPGFTGLIGSETSLQRGTQKKALVVEGLLSDAYHLDEALAGLPGWQVRKAPYVLDMAGPSLRDYPLQYADLRPYSLVVLSNISAAPLGPEGRLQLLTFVQNGGGLLLLGGKGCDTQALRGSFLEEALPVTFPDKRWNLQREQGPLHTENGSIIGGADWPAQLACPFIHQATPKSGMTIVAKAGANPFIVAGTCGKGRVVCVLGTAFAAPWADRKSFADWEKWPGVLKSLLAWAAEGGR